MGIPLVIAEIIPRRRRVLRRYAYGDGRTCVQGYHDASVILGDVELDDSEPVHGDNWPHDDPRWPLACDGCGYRFADEDRWQRNDNRILRLPDGREFMFWGSFGMCVPPGTMVRADWYDAHAEVPGESWLIALPDGGEWVTTQRATGGGHWEVTGTAPRLTATPSIWHDSPSGWHGFVRDGELVDA